MAYLVISGKYIKSDCSNVVSVLKEMNIDCHITPNITIEKGVMENGCQILLIFDPLDNTNIKEKISHIWYKLKDELFLECAHLTLPNYNNVNFCINEYLS